MKILILFCAFVAFAVGCLSRDVGKKDADFNFHGLKIVSDYAGEADFQTGNDVFLIIRADISMKITREADGSFSVFTEEEAYRGLSEENIVYISKTGNISVRGS